jgi:CubicO group peptidase (beta-lactamase class C family)
MKSSIFAGLLGTLVFAGPAHAAAASSAPLTAQLQAVVDDPAIPLASLAVVAIRGGKVVYRHDFGYKRLPVDGKPGLPVDGNTMFRIASVSKLVTTLGVMKLVEQGKLELDADVGTYLGYPLRNPNFPDRPITLRMLLSHTSSLRDDAGYSWDGKVLLKDVLVPGGALYGAGAAWAKDRPPGYFNYVNLNWGVIGTIMERVTGERFDRLMRRLILAPMGLHAGYNPVDFTPAELADVATIYRKRTADDKEIWDSKGPWIAQVDDYSANPPALRPGADTYVPGSNGTLFGPQGSLRASAGDLAKLMGMLLDHGRYGGKRILTAASVDRMLGRQWTHNGQAGAQANGDTYRGLFNAWGLGVQHYLDLSAASPAGPPATAWSKAAAGAPSAISATHGG